MKQEYSPYFVPTSDSNLEPFPIESNKTRYHQVVKAQKLPMEIRNRYPLTDQTYKDMVNMSNQKYLSGYRSVPAKYEGKPAEKTLIIGKSPGWPGSDTKYISKVNMKNIGKRDKISIDDDGDQRILKLKKEKEQPTSKQLYKYSNKPLCLQADSSYRGNFSVFGVGPYKVGATNLDKHLATTAYHEKSFKAKSDKYIKHAWIEEPLTEAEKLEKKIKENENEQVIQDACPNKSSLNDYWTEVIQNPVQNIHDDFGKILDKPTDPSIWSVELDRKEDRFSNLVKSSIDAENEKQVLFEKIHARRLATAVKIKEHEEERARYLVTANQNSMFYTPPIRLPPKKVWDAIDNGFDEETNLFHSPYKTIASKRHYLVHPDPVPDLRDWRKKHRKEYVVGYHTSVFR